MSTTVYVIRHAEAEGNVYRRCQGQYDSLLTPRGYAQLEALSARFADKPIAAVYASDLFRARTTAEAVARTHGLQVQLRPALREIAMGDWEDVPWAELSRIAPEAYTAWNREPWSARPPRGETMMEAGARMLDEVKALCKAHQGQMIAVVSHGSAIRGALTLAHGYAPEQLVQIAWGDNTCVAKWTVDAQGAVQVLYENDAAHLQGGLSTFASIGWKDEKGIPSTEQIWYRPIDLDKDAPIVQDFATQAGVAYERLCEQIKQAGALHARAACLGCRTDGSAVGMVLLMPTAQPEQAQIAGLFVENAWHGQGLGQQLLGQAVSVARSMGKTQLLVQAPPDSATERFYREKGFERDTTGQLCLSIAVAPAVY